MDPSWKVGSCEGLWIHLEVFWLPPVEKMKRNSSRQPFALQRIAALINDDHAERAHWSTVDSQWELM